MGRMGAKKWRDLLNGTEGRKGKRSEQIEDE